MPRTAPWDDTACALGEGPLWHPGRQQLFWFDILARRLLTREEGATRHWQFDEMVSAAGWTGRDTLLIASETRLMEFEIPTGKTRTITPLEADTPETRSNDGRADPWGGFWIGTMGKSAQPGLGAIWRYYKGTLRRIVQPVTISNAICFAPGGSHAYYADTDTQIIMRQPLEPADGWPDGAVCDAEGNLWNAQWGAGRVACYSPGGRFLHAIPFPAAHTSCPAFGGPGLQTLYCTSARQDLPASLTGDPLQGCTFAVPGTARGQAEHRVNL